MQSRRLGLDKMLAVLEPAYNLEEVAQLARKLALENGVVVDGHELVGHADFIILIDYWRQSIAVGFVGGKTGGCVSL